MECSYTQYADTGIVAICLGCDRDNLEKCCKAIGKEIRKLQDSPMSERKLKAAKKQLLGQLAISSDNGETQCLSMGKSLLTYGHVKACICLTHNKRLWKHRTDISGNIPQDRRKPLPG